MAGTEHAVKGKYLSLLSGILQTGRCNCKEYKSANVRELFRRIKFLKTQLLFRFWFLEFGYCLE